MNDIEKARAWMNAHEGIGGTPLDYLAAYGAHCASEAEQERDALARQLEYDRTVVAGCVTAVDKELASRDWLGYSRGSYEWDDARYQQEFSQAATAIWESLAPMRRVAANWSGCSKDGLSIARARINVESERDALAAQVAELRSALERVALRECHPEAGYRGQNAWAPDLVGEYLRDIAHLADIADSALTRPTTPRVQQVAAGMALAEAISGYRAKFQVNGGDWEPVIAADKAYRAAKEAANEKAAT